MTATLSDETRPSIYDLQEEILGTRATPSSSRARSPSIYELFGQSAPQSGANAFRGTQPAGPQAGPAPAQQQWDPTIGIMGDGSRTITNMPGAAGPPAPPPPTEADTIFDEYRTGLSQSSDALKDSHKYLDAYFANPSVDLKDPVLNSTERQRYEHLREMDATMQQQIAIAYQEGLSQSSPRRFSELVKAGAEARKSLMDYLADASDSGRKQAGQHVARLEQGLESSLQQLRQLESEQLNQGVMWEDDGVKPLYERFNKAISATRDTSNDDPIERGKALREAILATQNYVLAMRNRILPERLSANDPRLETPETASLRYATAMNEASNQSGESNFAENAYQRFRVAGTPFRVIGNELLGIPNDDYADLASPQAKALRGAQYNVNPAAAGIGRAVGGFVAPENLFLLAGAGMAGEALAPAAGIAQTMGQGIVSRGIQGAAFNVGTSLNEGAAAGEMPDAEHLAKSAAAGFIAPQITHGLNSIAGKFPGAATVLDQMGPESRFGLRLFGGALTNGTAMVATEYGLAKMTGKEYTADDAVRDFTTGAVMHFVMSGPGEVRRLAAETEALIPLQKYRTTREQGQTGAVKIDATGWQEYFKKEYAKAKTPEEQQETVKRLAKEMLDARAKVASQAGHDAERETWEQFKYRNYETVGEDGKASDYAAAGESTSPPPPPPPPRQETPPAGGQAAPPPRSKATEAPPDIVDETGRARSQKDVWKDYQGWAEKADDAELVRIRDWLKNPKTANVKGKAVARAVVEDEINRRAGAAAQPKGTADATAPNVPPQGAPQARKPGPVDDVPGAAAGKGEAETQSSAEPAVSRPAPAAAETVKPESPLPDYVREEIDRHFATATKAGIFNEIEDLSARGLVAKQIAPRIRARVPGEDAASIVRAVRAKLGIPSQDEQTDFAAWQAEYHNRKAQEMPNAAPAGPRNTVKAGPEPYDLSQSLPPAKGKLIASRAKLEAIRQNLVKALHHAENITNAAARMPDGQLRQKTLERAAEANKAAADIRARLEEGLIEYRDKGGEVRTPADSAMPKGSGSKYGRSGPGQDQPTAVESRDEGKIKRQYSRRQIERRLQDWLTQHDQETGRPDKNSPTVIHGAEGEPPTVIDQPVLPSDALDGLTPAEMMRYSKFIDEDAWSNITRDMNANQIAALQDEMMSRIAETKGDRLERAIKTAKNGNDPRAKFLAAYLENQPPMGEQVPKEWLDAGKLTEDDIGKSFEIHGEKFRVEVGDDGNLILRDHIIIENPESLGKIPVDKGSLKEPAEADIGDEPLNPDEVEKKTTGRQGSLLGERFEGSDIGSKTGSMFGDMSRGAASGLDAEVARQVDEAREQVDNDQQPLFSKENAHTRESLEAMKLGQLLSLGKERGLPPAPRQKMIDAILKQAGPSLSKDPKVYTRQQLEAMKWAQVQGIRNALKLPTAGRSALIDSILAKQGGAVLSKAGGEIYTRDQLQAMKWAQLLEIAKARGIPVAGPAVLVENILEQQASNVIQQTATITNEGDENEHATNNRQTITRIGESGAGGREGPSLEGHLVRHLFREALLREPEYQDARFFTPVAPEHIAAQDLLRKLSGTAGELHLFEGVTKPGYSDNISGFILPMHPNHVAINASASPQEITSKVHHEAIHQLAENSNPLYGEMVASLGDTVGAVEQFLKLSPWYQKYDDNHRIQEVVAYAAELFNRQLPPPFLTEDQIRALYPLYERFTRGEAGQSEQIRGDEGVDDLSLARDHSPPFYHKSERVIGEKMADRALPIQVRAMLLNAGVKPDEMKWSGLDSLLAEHEGPITKQQVLDHIRANRVEIEEVEKGPRGEPALDKAAQEADEAVTTAINALRDVLMKSGMPDREARDVIVDLQTDGTLETLPAEAHPSAEAYLKAMADAAVAGEKAAESAQRYSDYVLPGGRDYRELLLTLPNPPKRWLNGQPITDEDLGTEFGRATAERMGQKDREDFKSSHWDEPNVLAHIRFNSRLDAEGRRVLHIEEIQSDWHQAGREKGYAKPGDPSRIQSLENKRLELERLGVNATVEQKQEWADVMNELVALKREEKGVPDAPFRKTWHEMAMRRAVRHAAEHGYDALSWTTGQQQAERYDLSKHVDQLEYDAAKGVLRAYREAKVVAEPSNVTPSRLAEFVGKDAADKLLAQPVHNGVRTLSGSGMQLGTEAAAGMRGFYDQILPAYAGKFGKKWGAAVGRIQIPTGANITRSSNPSVADRVELQSASVHSLPITDEMRRSVLEEGLPLFSKGDLLDLFVSPLNLIGGEMVRPLQKNATGRAIMRASDRTETKVASLVGKLANPTKDAYLAMKHADMTWLLDSDAKGYANFQKMQEDTVSGRVRPPNPRIAAISRVYSLMMKLTADEAERVRLPRQDGKPFQRSLYDRFLRHYTPDAMEAMYSQHGPLFDAIQAAMLRDNPGMTPQQVKDTMEAMSTPDPVKHNNALERLREIPNLPAYVEVNGKKVPILELDPLRAILGGAAAMGRRVYFYEEFGSDAEVDRLRRRFVEAGGDRRHFDNVISVLNRRPWRRVPGDPRNIARRLVKSADQLAKASMLSLSAAPNLFQTGTLLPHVGIANLLTAWAEVLRHPKMSAAQAYALGAMAPDFFDTSVQPGRAIEDVTRVITGTMSRLLLHQQANKLNSVIATIAFKRLAEGWVKHGFTDADIATAKFLRLTPKQIAEFKAGNPSRLTLNQIAQVGVQRTQYSSEVPHRKSAMQNVPLLNAIVAFNSYFVGRGKETVAVVNQARQALKSKNPRRISAAAWAIFAMLAASLGVGMATLMTKRAIRAQPVIGEDETAWDLVKQSLIDIQLLGPAQRTMDAFSYARRPEDLLISNFPTIRVAFDLLGILMNAAKAKDPTPLEKLHQFVRRYMPAERAVENWIDRLWGDDWLELRPKREIRELRERRELRSSQ